MDGLLRDDLSGGGPYWWGPGDMAPWTPLNPALAKLRTNVQMCLKLPCSTHTVSKYSAK